MKPQNILSAVALGASRKFEISGVGKTDWLAGALMAGLLTLWDYIARHTVFCLVPAFFIAGAMAALVKKEAILRYFGAGVRPHLSYSVASVSGTVLAVCSCTILPLFQGIYKRGAGIGPATAFLYSGPAINILAIVYTARVLGPALGAARAVAAVSLSVVVGGLMALLFRGGEGERRAGSAAAAPSAEGEERPGWATLLFFVSLVAILVIGTSPLELWIRLSAIILLILVASGLLIYHFTRDEVTDWGLETWDLAKKIFPVLLAGAFLVGVIAYFLPPESFRPYIGGNSLASCLVGAVVGALLYMPTLLEVPIVGTSLGYSQGVMGGGPALALLLAGPAVSLPSMLVLYRILGLRKTTAYIAIVVLTSALAGFIYGMVGG
ncbi:MAG: permease [Thermoplasmata archaeon]